MGGEPSKFRRSSFCNVEGCIEVATEGADHVRLRGTDSPNRAALTFTPAEWAAFVEGVKRGDFGSESG